MVERINISFEGRGNWAVKHEDGYLGFVRSRDEAESIGQHLVGWLSDQGRPAELHVEVRVERSFAPASRAPDRRPPTAGIAPTGAQGFLARQTETNQMIGSPTKPR